MFDWIFAPSSKTVEPTYPNLHEIIVDLESRIEKLEEENKDLDNRINKIQPVVYNITNKD
jgi:chaperonin cofactor prefoldin